ncbi:hypothetical protein BSZ35_05475 [Salinibacter sp. 10B]|nr:hypothetical protein BSZ35_05475 [Salinibacter sp. 10B]
MDGNRPSSFCLLDVDFSNKAYIRARCLLHSADAGFDFIGLSPFGAILSLMMGLTWALRVFWQYVRGPIDRTAVNTKGERREE